MGSVREQASGLVGGWANGPVHVDFIVYQATVQRPKNSMVITLRYVGAWKIDAFVVAGWTNELASCPVQLLSAHKRDLDSRLLQSSIDKAQCRTSGSEGDLLLIGWEMAVLPFCIYNELWSNTMLSDFKECIECGRYELVTAVLAVREGQTNFGAVQIVMTWGQNRSFPRKNSWFVDYSAIFEQWFEMMVQYI